MTADRGQTSRTKNSWFSKHIIIQIRSQFECIHTYHLHEMEDFPIFLLCRSPTLTPHTARVCGWRNFRIIVYIPVEVFGDKIAIYQTIRQRNFKLHRVIFINLSFSVQPWPKTIVNLNNVLNNFVIIWTFRNLSACCCCIVYSLDCKEFILYTKIA